MNKKDLDKIWVIDFGGQYAHLIARRIRELNVYSMIIDPDEISVERIREDTPKAIILSGGPSSIYEENAPKIPRWLLDINIPILGICYGHQLLAYMFGGKVSRGLGEFGRTRVKILDKKDLFKGLGDVLEVWMSHNDYVEKPPPDSEILAVSEDTGYIAAFRIKERKIFGVQFHPEVIHTERGLDILNNFLELSSCKRNWRLEDYLNNVINNIKNTVSDNEKVLCAVSGGVDSTVTASILKKAVGDRLVSVFVNHGLLREGEVEEVSTNLRRIGIEPMYIDASERFLNALRGVSDPEEKRIIIGRIFGEIFKEIISKDPSIKWLAQGTTYPDVIESGRSRRASKIKSHHNVAGLPEDLGLRLIEPLKDLYKDEVRRLGELLGIPREILVRHPFPGPGLAVRIIGEVNEERLSIIRKASRIVEEIIRRHGLYEKVWQAFPVLLKDKWVGIKGDKRSEGYIIVIRIVDSQDGMTADWSRVPYEILDEISRRIISEIREVTMVTYAITSKPPSTIEAE
ncbi:MAG: glutamine-hydrolyzing GMP synthase [Desulfurococcales archaeon]|jgi:GMP synthase (glutamine-hydrolysing)|nr:glutamine-hydrolyzing GMP synthase [Desulfurococcales archaeon]